ncbi:MAG: efflux RND transporter periplasmic adaptor subunit [Bacteroidales bacterium]
MKRLVLSGVAMMALTLMVTSCGAKKSDADQTAEVVAKPLVKVEQVHEQEIDQLVTYTATVESNKTNNISSSTVNRIKEILVEVGDKVTKDQTLVILDNVNIEQQKLNLDNQKRDYDRAVELLEIGGGTQQSVDQLKTQYESTKRQYENLVENTVLKAPMNGIVSARNYDNGDMTGQSAIVTIDQINPVKVLVNISESDYTKIKVGMPVDVTLDVYGDKVFKGKVKIIYPIINSQTRTFTTEVEIPNADMKIKPGMFARVQFNYGTVNHVVVPDLSILKQTGSNVRYVFVYSGGVVSIKHVELGKRIDDKFELLSGLENNAQVVVSGQSKLIDGIQVEVLND